MARITKTTDGRVRWKLYLGSEEPPLLSALVADPDAVLGGFRSVARESAGRKRFYRLDDDAGRPSLYVKVFSAPSGPWRLGSLWRGSKASREAATARQLERLGFRAAAPLAVGEESRYGLLGRSFSVIRALPSADLRTKLADPGLSTAARRRLLQAFGRFAHALHDAGVDQDDFAPNNFLVSDTGEFILIDFERCTVGRPLGDRRWKLLAKLHRADLEVPRTDRLRFLYAYLGEGADAASVRRAWQRIAKAFREVRVRDARHAARSAFKVGRYLEREGTAWLVRAREACPVRRLELPPEEARRAWILAHQLERLRLPALRPVRLGGSYIELEDPGPQPELAARAELIQAARRRFEGYGVFEEPGDWLLTPSGARLIDPRVFRLTLS